MVKEVHQRTVTDSVERAISFLRKKQLASGEFFTLAAADMELKVAQQVHSVYIPTYIAHSLSFANAWPGVGAIIRRMIHFLVEQQEDGGIWRFFGKAAEFPPPDFDDTCCALAVLVRNGRAIPDLFPLLAKYRSASGQFYTWIDDEMNQEGLHQTDAGVNANILFYAGLCRRSFPEIVGHLNAMVGAEEYHRLSIYTLSEYPAIYLMTRAYRDASVAGLEVSMPRVARHLLKQRGGDGGWGDELSTALATVSLLNAGHSVSEVALLIDYLLERQLDGRHGPVGVAKLQGYEHPVVEAAVCCLSILDASGAQQLHHPVRHFGLAADAAQ